MMDFRIIMEGLEKGACKVCVVGMGYVGLPLAVAFAKSGLKVYGFDISAEKLKSLREGKDPNRELGDKELSAALKKGLEFTDDSTKIRESDFVILCVPTPVDQDNDPDMSFVESASAIAGKNLRENSIVILESTVYPGTTEEVVRPALERESGLKWREGFALGYSPERINPGDKEHTLERITKVVSGDSEECGRTVYKLYSRITNAFQARDIKTAEAAKVIENIQRDLNIALMNELTIIFNRMGIDIRDVLEAAGTKWNFQMFSPGLVGGHCIGVDPYYLVYKARQYGYDSKVILAGREINNYMPSYSVELLEKALSKAGKSLKGARVLLLGLTFKKNVSDMRNAPSKHIIKALLSKGVIPIGHDPFLDKNNIEKHFGIGALEGLESVKGFDAVMVVTDHDVFRNISMDKLKSMMGKSPVLIDIRRLFDRRKAESSGILYSGF